MSKVSINVPKGTGQSFLRELVYAGIRLKSGGFVSNSRRGLNDIVEYDDTVYNSTEQSTINTVISNHDPTTIISFDVEDSKNGDFINDETKRIDRMSVNNRKQEDLEELIGAIEQLGEEGLADYFLV